MSAFTASKSVVDKLWEIAANVEKGQTAYWTAEQIKWLAHEIEPPDWQKTKIQKDIAA